MSLAKCSASLRPLRRKIRSARMSLGERDKMDVTSVLDSGLPTAAEALRLLLIVMIYVETEVNTFHYRFDSEKFVDQHLVLIRCSTGLIPLP